MNRNERRIFQQVGTAWNNVMYRMQKMHQASQVRPVNYSEIFRLDNTIRNDGNAIKLLIGPVVVNVPERAGSLSVNLFIVAKGWLTFEGPDFGAAPLKTKDFGTDIGYFRLKEGCLEHVYGVHYDMDEKNLGHPVFHAQISPKMDFVEQVNNHFRLNAGAIDRMGALLRNVRTPSAQMDIFSVLTQICADHLIFRESAEEALVAFKDLRTAGEFLVGAAHRLSYLNSPVASGCYRSMHWYGAQ